MDQRAPHAFPWWVVFLIVLGALGVASLAIGALFAPQTLLSSGQPMTEAVRVWARYAAAYSVALSLTLLALLAVRARRILAGVLLQAAFAEFLLAIVAIVNQRWEQIPADILLAAVFVICAGRLFGQAPWHAAVWREPSDAPTSGR